MSRHNLNLQPSSQSSAMPYGHARYPHCTTIFNLEHAKPSLARPRVVAELRRFLNVEVA